MLSKHRWLSWVITKAWQSCTMLLYFFGSFDIASQRRVEQENSIMYVGRVIMKKPRSGEALCVCKS